MFKFDLLNIFEGLIRNYSKFKLDKNSTKESIVNKELSYISLLGELLGYSSTIDTDENNNKIIKWKQFNDIDSTPNKLILYYSREDDITKDVLALQTLLNKIKMGHEDTSYMLNVEVSSEARIKYLNSLINEPYCVNKEILIIYKIPQILESKSDLSAYLFKDGEIYRERHAKSYIDIFGTLKSKFKNY